MAAASVRRQAARAAHRAGRRRPGTRPDRAADRARAAGAALLAAGKSNRGIAAELYVTLDTVKKHVGRVLDKLSAANRTKAAARALQLGLIG